MTPAKPQQNQPRKQDITMQDTSYNYAGQLARVTYRRAMILFSKSRRLTSKFFFLCILVLTSSVPNPCYAQEHTVVKIGVYDNAPIVFKDKNGGYSGLAVEILEYIATQEEWKIEYVFGSFAQCLERLERGDIDLQVYIAYSKERALKFDFNQETLLSNWGVVYVRPESGIETILDLEGKRVALMEQSIHPRAFMKMIEAFHVQPVIIPVAEHDEGFKLVSENKADAVIVNRIFGLAHAKMYNVEATNIIFNPIEIRYAAPKGTHPDILAAIDKHLKALKADEKSLFYQSFNKAFGLTEPSIALPKWVFFSFFLALLLSGLLFCTNRILNHRVRAKTRELQSEISERQQAEKLLRESESRLRTLINTVSELVWLKDSQGIYLLCNARFERLYGAKEKDIIGKTDYDFVDKELADLFRQNDQLAMAAGKPSTNEEELVFADDGHKEILETIKTPMRGSDGTIIGVLGIARDITERKHSEEEKEKLERRLQQAQKMEAIGTLAGGIAHDFNNILAIILGYTELAQEDALPGTPLKKDLEQILSAAKRAKELVKQILTFSRQSLTDILPIQIQPLIKEGLKMLRSSIPSTISITEEIEENGGTILADPTQIYQILMNLCTNAYQAMEETGGVLSVTLKTTFIDINEHVPPGEYLELTVSDTGRGIGPDVITKIFDPFFTTKEPGKGTGMGLAIIHGIMQDYGGAITVESQLGKGSAFHAYFPVVEKDAYPEIKASETIPMGTERILFIDDEEFLTEMGKDMLERLGYHVTARHSSLEALATFQNTPNEFDLVITDQTMPDITGSDLARLMLKIRPDIPIILCTGYSNLIDESSAKAIGIKEFALKPLTKETIAKVIRKVLSEAVQLA